MSNLLREAIVDAEALRESALKNAETIVIEKYSSEVKQTLEKLLEQEDELGMPELPAEEAPAPADPLAGGIEDPAMAPAVEPALEEEVPAEGETLTDEVLPLAATDDFAELEGQNLEGFLGEDESAELNIDLGALQESIDNLKQTLDEEEDIEITEEDINNLLEEEDEDITDDDDDDDDVIDAEDVSGTVKDTVGSQAAGAGLDAIMGAMSEEKGTVDLTDSLVDAIVEKLTVDMGADLSGWAGRSSDDVKYQIEKELAHRRSTDVEEEMKDLKKAQEELVFENNQLTEKLSEYEGVISELKEGLQDTNLSNARLLYTNRVLRNPSLNERQKDKIVETISNAGSVTDAKTIFETLQSTVEASPNKKGPQSLSEAIGRRSTVLRATRKEEPASDPFQDRMKRLAGIK